MALKHVCHKFITDAEHWNVLTYLLAIMYSLMLQRDPVCVGDPQRIENTARRHSHRKWKSMFTIPAVEKTH